ncbi:MAG TPA: hypothetical protein VGG64_17810 [Pirellulales bacterium]|jgi:hypothetical protein
MDEKPNPYDTMGSPYCGMTINERLAVAGLFDQWDAAVARRDRAEMIRLLTLTDLPVAAAEQTTDAVLASQKLSGS